MASLSAVLLLLFAGLFTAKAGDDCRSYFTTSNVYKPGSVCVFPDHCCGSCDFRYCCSSPFSKFDQNVCGTKNTVVISSVAGGLVILVVLFITCCCCPCCCMYQMCRKPRPVVGTHVTAITNTSVIQQPPAAQGIQYSQYQPVPNQPGYAHPMQTAPYQGQPYAPGPPPPYHVAMSPGYPTSQYAYDGGQAVYPTQPPAQPAPVYMPPETSSQPAYNPAYVQPPKTTY
ncbi:protein shisa-5-like isoform X2 [Puntigrus tetrazona]|uniref:protein shisa-5-like isoform X2 n=1 Tax=Puntigrus tetrazona TaxID=1606681 RepID=UPI001C8A3A6B|nr:protein shisa-5-like isoform X2 [Puntigrus tetrazona]